MKKHYSTRLLAGICLLAALPLYNLKAQSPGDPDPSFGVNGRLIENIEKSYELVYSTAFLPDGKILTSGDLWTGLRDYVFLTRQNANGTLDNTFGNGGYTYFGNDSTDYLPFAMAQQSDGKVIVAGWRFDGNTIDGFAVRILPNGAPDPSFADNGLYILDQIGSTDRFYAVKIDANGNILLAGGSNAGSGVNSVVVRLLPDGIPDPTFGSAGIASLTIPSADYLYGIDLFSNGNIVAAGYSTGGNGIVVQLDPNGIPLSTFGPNNDGIVEVDNPNGSTVYYSVKVLANGKIVAAGNRAQASGRYFLFTRFLADGSLDTGFSGDGESTLLAGSSFNTLRDIVVLSDQKILGAGFQSSTGSFNQAALVRINGNGTPDNTFGSNGIATNFFTGFGSAFYHFDLLSDGRILAAGYRIDDSGLDLALAQFQANGTLDATFGSTAPGWQFDNLQGGSDIPLGLGLDYNGKAWMACNLAASGNFRAIRYSGSGAHEIEVDPSSGFSFNPEFSAMSCQPDGKLLFGATRQFDSLLFYRILPDGSPDTGLGQQGVIKTAIPNLISLNLKSFVAQADGKILACGGGLYSNGAYYSFLYRMLSNGSPDPAFNGNGFAFYDESGITNPTVVRTAPGQKILLGGYSYNATTQDIFVQLFDANGHPVSNFGTAGEVSFDAGQGLDETVYDMTTDNEGRYLIAFTSRSATEQQTGVARLLSNGQRDNSFGTNGVVMFPNDYMFGINDQEFISPVLAVQANGRILLSTYRGPGSDFALYCLLSNGSPDPAFGVNGTSIQDISGYDDFATGMVLMPDSSILQCGVSFNGLDQDVALIRYLPDLSVGTKDFSALEHSMLVYPNPIGLSTTLRYDNPASGTVTVQLENAEGRMVQTCFTGWQAAGEQAISLHPNAALPAGWYVCRITTAAGEAAVRVVKN